MSDVDILDGKTPAPGPFTSLTPPEQGPDARLVVPGRAHAAVWHSDTPDGHGVIGGFSADSEESAHAILAAAEDLLREKGHADAIGPMNGNTWRGYRFVVESTGRPPFFMEPHNPSTFPLWWASAGYRELARYSSSALVLHEGAVVSEALKDRLLKGGVRIRNLNPDDFEADLRRIFAVSLSSFSANFLYTPIEEAAFLRSYLKIRNHVDPGLVFLAERDGQTLGFVFGIADLAAEEDPSLIVKTLAVDPQARCAGLGSLLVDEVQKAGREKGFREALHVLQHDDNNVRRITSRHEGAGFRKYALFSKAL